MDETNKIGFLVAFPDEGLTLKQKRELKNALKSAVVSVLTDRLRNQINVQPKVNDWADCKKR
jgi:hypothetical protein